jgi:hypothetical protein
MMMMMITTDGGLNSVGVVVVAGTNVGDDVNDIYVPVSAILRLAPL